MTNRGKEVVIKNIAGRYAWLKQIEKIMPAMPDGYGYWLGFGNSRGDLNVDIPMNDTALAEFEGKLPAGWKRSLFLPHEDAPYNTCEWRNPDFELIEINAYIRADMEGSTCQVLTKTVTKVVLYSEEGCNV